MGRQLNDRAGRADRDDAWSSAWSATDSGVPRFNGLAPGRDRSRLGKVPQQRNYKAFAAVFVVDVLHYFGETTNRYLFASLFGLVGLRKMW